VRASGATIVSEKPSGNVHHSRRIFFPERELARYGGNVLHWEMTSFASILRAG